MTTWEYLNEWCSPLDTARMNQRGDEGWELVAVVVMPDNQQAQTIAIYKRPRKPEPHAY